MKYKWQIIALLVSSLCICSELMLGRWINPIFGSSVISWSVLVGMFLLGLSVGQILSYRLVKLNLSVALFSCAGFHVMIPFLRPLFVRLMTESQVAGLWVEVLFHGMISFNLALTFGFMFIKIYQSVAGHQQLMIRLVIMSSIGSFVGVALYVALIMSAGFFPIDWYFYASALVLSLIGVFLSPQLASISGMVGLLGFTTYSAMTDSSPVFKDEKLISFQESPMSVLIVTEGKFVGLPVRNFRTNFRKDVVDSMGLINLNYFAPSGVYNIMSSSVVLLDKTELEVLILGSGVGTLAKTMEYYALQSGKKLSFTQVEFDPAVVKEGEKSFGLITSQVVVEDARKFISRTKKKFDLIVVNAFQQNAAPPSHMQSIEFYRLIKGSLSKEGIIAINLLSKSRFSVGTMTKFMEHFIATIGACFPEFKKDLFPFEGKKKLMNSALLISARSLDYTRFEALRDDMAFKHIYPYLAK